MRGRGGWSYCCSGSRIYMWFCCCYMAVLLFILASFIFWLIFLPQELKFTVTDASLTRFNLSSSVVLNDNNLTTTSSTAKPTYLLSYNLSLNIAIRNPNKRNVGVYFDRIQVIANYRKKRFASVSLNSTTPFYQGHKNTTALHAVLQGQQTLSFKERDLKKYESETSSGVYGIDVKLALRLRVRFGKIKSAHFKPRKINCGEMRIPLSSSINETTSFNETTSINSTTSGIIFWPRRCVVYIFTSRGDD